MSARTVYLIMKLLSLIYETFLMRLADLARKKPLPAEVADIYPRERYRQFLDYTSERKKLAVLSSAVSLAIDLGLIFSPVFRWIERAAGGNVYRVLLLTVVVFSMCEAVIDILFGYWETFFVEEKYGLNKKNRKEFFKDEILNLFGTLVIMAALGVFLTFVIEHMAVWTNGFTAGWKQALILGLVIGAAAGVILLLMSLFSLFLMRRKYTFTPLEEGPLKEKIMALQKDSRKKVRLILVYNESKKSNGKNAALLKLLWHREFWIADNFLMENAEDELLAVLSHEIGHLKHKKSLPDLVGYAGILAVFILFILLATHPETAFSFSSWVRGSFGLSVNNTYLLFLILAAILSPVLRLIGIFGNYRSRKEENEADEEAVKNGYGEALIRTFKELSHDELVNVNPHPFIEFLEYDHPGMYKRIVTIRKAQEKGLS